MEQGDLREVNGSQRLRCRVFSRLASSKSQNASQEVDEDDERLVEDELNYLDEERQNTIDEVVSQVGLIHPITYDGYDVCENVRLNTL